ncbi:MAG TPA: hypothetical protein VN578_04125 [Candidatus Binatia bacterium]|jgi:hypothetical protein|nr:hypothetical protein [Candidatus Binatia bacterium]
MKTALIFTAAVACLSVSLGAAESDAKADVTAAAKKLAEKDNYSWHTTVVVPEDARFKPGPVEGKTEKDGFTLLSMTNGDNERQAVLKGEKGAATTRDGDWQSLSEMASGEGPGRFMAMMLRNFKAPADQAAQLATDAKELKKEGDLYSSELTEEGAKKQLSFRPRAGGDAPSVSNAKGSVKFWLKDGALTKYEFNVKGTVSFNGNDFDQDRTTTVVIKDVGNTKVTVPDGAKQKVS